jgi:hypothetical protein
MLYQIIPFAGGVLSLALSLLMKSLKRGEKAVRVTGVLLLLYKTAEYVYLNVSGNSVLPVEISTVTYFATTIALAFRIKKMYPVVSFFGILAGLGYWAGYTFCGFLAKDAYTLREVLLGACNHGYLLVAGACLYFNYDFGKANRLSVWAALLAMLLWAAVYYTYMPAGPTFIYYLIHPNELFLFLAPYTVPNLLISLGFYAAAAVLFHLLIKCFYRFNNAGYGGLRKPL